ncbi:HNH endonuclease signature motif containing protein [Dietzia sp. PP-33]|jgi:hypothetical protein|uniref:HNH endonuclease signature motif containing protein n=1 Tax=Dietzia sp. PP-33 TaxID=2957500 RepID=UPI0029A17251|nr:DUF222 domain-containing protein [Dietzia sp. PP-33]MDX2356454.1 DUF222 domain-containing protein [Dietzia sp. PP-33]
MGAKDTEQLFACESEVARLAVDGENRASALRIRAVYRTFEAAVEHVRAIDVAAHESELPVRDYAAVDPWELARSELAVALGVHANRAGAMVDLSIELVERCPAILEEIESGRIDERTASTMVGCLRGVTDDDLCRAAAEIAARRYVESLEAGGRLGRGQLRRMMDRAVRGVDPDGVRRRRNEALRGRGVWIRTAPDGMASVSASLSAAGAEVLAERLDQMAGTGTWSRGAGSPGPGKGLKDDDDEAGAGTDDRVPDDRVPDERGPDERRADALVALATEGPGPATDSTARSCPDPAADQPARPAADQSAGPAARSEDEPAAEAPLRPHVTVIMTGDGRSEVFFRRSGEGSLAMLRDLLGRARGATFETVFTGRAGSDHRAALGYAVPEWLARRIRLRDGTCRHPGCSVAADRCDLDHVVPFLKEDPESGGLTVEWNLICLCRTHHRLKTFSGWGYRVDPDGVVDIVTETGRTVRTWPSGPLARARRVEQMVDADSSGGCDCGVARVESAPGEVAREPTHSDGSPRGTFIGFRYTTRERRRRARRQGERDLLILERRARRDARRRQDEADAITDPPPF